MEKGICIVCKKHMGGITDSGTGPWECSGCKKMYCENCAGPKLGFWSPKPTCPTCGRELKNLGF